MESAWPILIFLAGLFGLTLLALVCGIQSKELERAERGSEPPVDLGWLLARRSLAPAPVGARPVPCESLVRRLETHLREQATLAAHFVERPSLETLHGRVHGADPEDDGLFQRVERFMRSERESAVSFVSNPSIESLYGLAVA